MSPLRLLVPAIFLLTLSGCATQRIAQTSTGQLRFQYVQTLQRIYLAGGRRGPVGPTGKTSQDYDILDLERISSELYRRWQAGDQAAYLPTFGVMQRQPTREAAPTRTAVTKKTTPHRRSTTPERVREEGGPAPAAPPPAPARERRVPNPLVV